MTLNGWPRVASFLRQQCSGEEEDAALRDPCEALNADGTIRTGADRRRVPPAFEPVIATMVDAFRGVSDDSFQMIVDDWQGWRSLTSARRQHVPGH
jgi:hypothetical protein